MKKGEEMTEERNRPRFIRRVPDDTWNKIKSAAAARGEHIYTFIIAACLDKIKREEKKR